MTAYTFDQLINFTRTSAATYVNSAGLVALTPASRNLLTFTQEFDNAAWVKANSTITANATAAPDGTATADKIVATTAVEAYHPAYYLQTLTASTYVFSCYAKAAEYSLFRVSETALGRFCGSFDLANGTVVAGSTGGAQFISASVTPAGNGWYRCAIVFTGAAETYAPAIVGYPNSGATLNGNGAIYTGDGTSGVFIWGAQLEQASAATDYTKNVGGVFPPRFDYDPVTLAPKGLLIEEQRTNLLTYSEQFDNAVWSKYDTTITANATTSPSGDNSADLILPNTSNAFHAVEQTVSIGTRTFSLYAKAAGYNYLAVTNSGPLFAMFNLSDGTVVNQSGVTSSSITAVGNGWYRCVVTLDAIYGGFTVYVSGSASSVTSFAGDGTSGVYLWGAQAEAGAFATSYIPTVASQVTRTADQTTIDAPNFAPWYNQSKGTFVISMDCPALGGRAEMSVDDGSTANALRMISQVANPFFVARVAAANVAVLDGGTITANTTYTQANAYAVNNYGVSVNGGAAVTSASGAVPTVNRMTIGWDSFGSHLNGHVRSIRYYPTRLSDAQLAVLSA